MPKNIPDPKSVEAILHDDARRTNIPTSELQSIVPDTQKAPIKIAYEKRNPDLDPQLVWRGKYDGDDTITVKAPPLYIQEKIHPKALIEDLRVSGQIKKGNAGLAEEIAQYQLNLFSDFNGLPKEADKTDFYQHEQNWSNRMILGDSLQVMASLAEREGLRGQVQAIYFDPPYGIKFNSNFQWSTNSRDVKDGKADNFTREPEQVKAFRDTWEDGIHSYLSYLRDRFIVARDLLTDSGSIFVQIGDENVHLVRVLLDEIFGNKNIIAEINFSKTSNSTDDFLGQTTDYILWYAKNKSYAKYNRLYKFKKAGETGGSNYNRAMDKNYKTYSINKITIKDYDIYSLDNLTSQSMGRSKGEGAASWFAVDYKGQIYKPSLTVRWKTNKTGMDRLLKANRLEATENRLGYIRFLKDFPVFQITNRWDDVSSSFMNDKVYIVQTSLSVVQRCLLMATDPGDLVLDPTCGSGTTAYVAEQWGRRWITIDTSRVALALARARLMGARYPYYLMADSIDGQEKEAAISGNPPSKAPCGNNINMGFVYERVPHITLKAIANNAQIDEIWEKWQEKLEPVRKEINRLMGQNWEEWEIPVYPETPWPKRAQELFQKLKDVINPKTRLPGSRDIHEWRQELAVILKIPLDELSTTLPKRPATPWPLEAISTHQIWREYLLSRQQEIDASIAAKAEYELLYDKPYEDKRKVRVAGPFTVESISPYRALGVGENDELLDSQSAKNGNEVKDFTAMIIDNLKTAGVQQAHKEDKINFTSLVEWPGEMICAEGRYMEGEHERRAAIFIGPEFGTVNRADLADAAREAGDAKFDLLIACAFNFDANAEELQKMGYLPIIKARMNADLHMSESLKKTGKGNLFVVFGEPDIEIFPETAEGGAETGNIMVKINGVDVYNPAKGEIISDNANDIACWFIDTDYNEESFFVRQAYFLGQKNPYDSLKRALNAEIDKDMWETLNSAVSRSFPKPKNGRIAVKVINHLGDEVMKVFKVA